MQLRLIIMINLISNTRKVKQSGDCPGLLNQGSLVIGLRIETAALLHLRIFIMIALQVGFVVLNAALGFYNLKTNSPGLASFNFFALGFCTMGLLDMLT